MRWFWFAGLALVCVSSVGQSQDQDAASSGPGSSKTGPLPFRCLYERSTSSWERVKLVGNKWLDTRIRSETSFLNSLYRTDARLMLYAKGAPRDAFIRFDGSGNATVGINAAWFAGYCVNEKEHRTGRPAYVLAHLYAHAVQAKRGCELTEIARELHADLLAGWYLGRRNIATLKGKPPLRADFTALMFRDRADYRNEAYEHGRPDVRARALAEGFKLWRTDRLSIPKVYRRGLKMFPAAHAGLTGKDAKTVAPLWAAKNEVRVKVECTHQTACEHKLRCIHPKKCTHKTSCDHLLPCYHRKECIHDVECAHKSPCVHRMPCTHRVRCIHEKDCLHRIHATDYEHDHDEDVNGRHIPCVHRTWCMHFQHAHDYEHVSDLAHDSDFKHDFDRLHRSDLAHEFDTDHLGHPAHEFDWAHESDPVHAHDLKHEWDPVHDYDITLEWLVEPTKKKKP